MLYSKGLFTSCVFLYVLSILIVNTSQNSRQKRQILQDQPRILTQNGHLVFQGGINHNITFKSGSGGKIFIDDIDLKTVATQVRTNKESIASMQGSSGSTSQGSLGQRLENVENQLSSVTNLQNRVDTLASRADSYMAQGNNFHITVDNRLVSIENRLNNGGSGNSQYSDLRISLQNLQNRVLQLENRQQDTTDSIDERFSSQGRQQRRMRRRLNSLRDTVTQLQELLNANECSSNPCQNGATCVDLYNGYLCRCPDNFKGSRCEQDVNECAEYAGTDLGCQNGATCVNTHGGYRCNCAANWYGIHCSERHDDCTSASHSELCGHGTCVNENRVQAGQPRFRCICQQGWTTDGSNPACVVDVNECAGGNRCSIDPPVLCINTPGSFTCGNCPAGYTGNGYSCSDINECLINHGGCSIHPPVQCFNNRGSSTCGNCPAGYTGNGRACNYVGDTVSCSVNNGGCHPVANCISTVNGRSCQCPDGYEGSGIGISGCRIAMCGGVQCQNGASCVSTIMGPQCACPEGYYGPACSEQTQTCEVNYCQNGGTCVHRLGLVTCQCPDGFTGAQCENQISACGGEFNTETGSIQYPAVEGTSYAHQVFCSWTIYTHPNKIINLHFTRFDVEEGHECEYDSLRIFDGPTSSSDLIGQYCNDELPNGGTVSSTGNSLSLLFETDESIAHSGFLLNWDSTGAACGGNLEGSDSGTITSPNYPANYPHNIDCIWTVRVTPGNIIEFTFSNLAIETHSNCSYDHLEIRDGLTRHDPLLNRYCTSSSPEPLRTTGPFAYLWFHTDLSISDLGFEITYSIPSGGASGCGGALTGNSGQFTSPGYPSDYANDLDCVWTITVNPASNVVLTFTAFDLEHEDDCDFDTVKVYSGADLLVRSVCGSTLPAPISVNSNVMTVTFRTDYSVTGSGFAASWSVGCSSVHTEPTGNIVFNTEYTSTVCQSMIQVAENSRIRFQFQQLDIGGSDESCSGGDYIEIFDGETESSIQIGERICGGNIGRDYYWSTGNTMLIKVTFDSIPNSYGPNMGSYISEEIEIPNCGGVLVSRSDYIQSPGYPNAVLSGYTCTWHIMVDPGLKIKFSFHSILFIGRTADGCSNYVEVFDNSTANPINSLGRFCGQISPALLTSSDNVMTIKTVVNQAADGYQGFTGSYRSENISRECGEEMTGSTGVITSPNYPFHYPGNQVCVWTIRGQFSGTQISLNFTYFDLEDNTFSDYLEIRDGATSSSPLRYRLYGRSSNLPANPIVSTSNTFYLLFHSNGWNSRTGFRLEYNMLSNGCGATLNSPTGSIISPNYPNPYYHEDSCTWIISVSRGSVIDITFEDFDIESHDQCAYDYLELRDDNEAGRLLMGNGTLKLCGANNPGNFTSTSNRVWIRLNTDFSIAGRGFILHYAQNCTNRVLTDLHGVIESPNFPNAYSKHMNCSWLIQAPASNKVNISFAAFNIEYHDECLYDRLQIKDGDSSTAPLLGNYCGTTIPAPFQSSSDALYLSFESDYSVQLGGFRLEYAFDGCGGVIFRNRGVLHSPGYPGLYQDAMECLWRVTADLGKRIQVTVTDLDLENSRDCQYDVLELFEGPDDTGNRVVQLCHTQSTEHTYTINSHVMYVRFKTDFSVGGRGFTLNYQAEDGGCGGNFTGRQGTIRSPGYPNNPQNARVCDYLITVAPGSNVVLNFTDIYLEGGRACSDFYGLTMFEGANISMPQVAIFCGLEFATVVRSSGNQVFLRLRTTSYGLTPTGKFSLEYSTGCGGLIVANDSAIQSLGFPSPVPRGTTCQWTVQVVPNLANPLLSLTFTNFDIVSYESCDDAYVQVSTGLANGTRYCGGSLPATIYASESMIVKLVSPFVTNGFRAIASSLITSCGGILNADSGRFTSPGYPNNYPINVECVWQIRIAPGNTLQLSFPEFNLNSNGNVNSDYLEIRSPDVNGQLLGRWIDQTISTNLNGLGGLWIKFRSDDMSPGVGFTAEWNTEYGGALTGDSGSVASPRYPSHYPSNVMYRWTITVPSDKVVKLEFIEFQMENRIYGSCMFADYLKIYDQDEISGELLGTYCGSDIGILYSTTNMVTLKFVTDSSVQAKGFLANYTAVPNSDRPNPDNTQEALGCGGQLNVTDELQTLTSPGNLTGYNNSMECIWSLNIPQGSSILINFNYMDLESHGVCYYDYVTFEDDSNDNYPSFCGRTLNMEPIIIRGLIGKIKFITDGSVTRTGFRLTYTTACGGSYQTATGATISSPNYPNNYPSDTNCTWHVMVRPGKTIGLNFNSQFHIADSGTCENDYLQLLNGFGADAPPLYRNTSSPTNTNGRYCGNTAPSSPLETSSNFLDVAFISDSSGVAQGFSFNFSEKSVACGGHIRLSRENPSGLIMSPNYPGLYPHHVDCVWIIITPNMQRAQLDFVGEFHIEIHGNCIWDYIEVRDGGTAFSRPIGGRICGNVLPSSVLSTGSVMYVRFLSDSSSTGKGFKARVSIATCGGRITARSGEVTSPNYPNNYGINLDCEWIIRVPVGHSISIDILSFSLQDSINCTADYVEIRETNATGYSYGRSCSYRLQYPSPLVTADNQAYIKFHSDGTRTARGFMLRFNASLEECGGDLTTPSGIITSPNYPQVYAHRRLCTWRIFAPEGRRVTLNIIDFDLEDHRMCMFDSLLVYNGVFRNSPLINRLCGSGVFATIESSSNSMRLVFVSDVSITGRGFKLTYTTDQESYCGGVLTDLSGNITNPGYGQGGYNHSVQCIWRIRNPNPSTNSSIILKFVDMSLEYEGGNCRFDSVTLREGRDENSPLIDNYCGNTTNNNYIHVPTPDVFVLFRSDGSIAHDGFKLLYKINPCGGVYTQPGVITSPNYPRDYDHNDNCIWQIVAPEGYRIRVHFSDFSFENHTLCDYDHLMIYNGGLPSSPMSKKYCGLDVPSDFVSQSNKIRIVMETDYSESSRGFSLEYSFTSGGCGGLYHSMTGNIASPNYPSSYPHNVECRWDINVPSGYVVNLRFNPPFDLQAGNCHNDHVQAFDSFVNGTLVSLGTWCSNVEPPVLRSSTRRMVVVFRSDASINGNGFSASWNSACGGLFTDQMGTFTSPGYPQDYENNMNCTYIIQPPANSLIALRFRHLEMEGSANNCGFDNLTVYDANSRRRPLTTICGREIPERDLVARENATVVFRTDQSETYKGFEMIYYSRVCGGVYTAPSARISSGLGNNNYAHNMNCSWNITVNENNIISFKFNIFHLEQHYRCGYDYVAFYNGPDENSPLIGRYCGNKDQVPLLIQTTGNRMFIRFITDSSVAHGGFRGAYWTTYGPNHGCGGLIRASSGSLLSFDADADGQYENYLDCSWTIETGVNTVITMTFTGFDLEDANNCIYDSLSIYDGPSDTFHSLGKFCGTSLPPVLTSSGNMLLVVFHSDSSVTGRGFNATFTSSPSLCGGSYNVTQETNIITSVEYPQPYHLPIRCLWVLDTLDSQKDITINVTDIDLASSSDCRTEYLLVRDFPLTPLGKELHYCGSRVPQPFDSIGQRVQIIYHLDQGSTGRGFRLFYQQADCNKEYRGSSGHITTPRQDGEYSSNTNCLFNITTPVNTFLSLYFYEFQLENHGRCSFDYLEVKNSSSIVVAKLCGSYLPNPIFLPDNQAILNFFADYSVTHYGYDIMYVASIQGPGCGGNISHITKGVLTSPSYPLASNTTQTCVWLITPPPRTILYYEFNRNNLPYATDNIDCGQNHVELLSGDHSQINYSYGTLCGNPTERENVNFSSELPVLIRFINNGNGPIFKIKFTIIANPNLSYSSRFQPLNVPSK